MTRRDKLNSLAKANQAFNLLNLVANNRDSNFSGIGVVFYSSLDNLPYLQLAGDSKKRDAIMLEGRDIIIALSLASNVGSPFHDGFHFVDVNTWKITHISQYISPPILPNKILNFHGSGARVMSAYLASLIPGIACAGVVSQSGYVQLFLEGVNIIGETK